MVSACTPARRKREKLYCKGKAANTYWDKKTRYEPENTTGLKAGIVNNDTTAADAGENVAQTAT